MPQANFQYISAGFSQYKGCNFVLDRHLLQVIHPLFCSVTPEQNKREKNVHTAGFKKLHTNLRGITTKKNQKKRKNVAHFCAHIHRHRLRNARTHTHKHRHTESAKREPASARLSASETARKRESFISHSCLEKTAQKHEKKLCEKKQTKLRQNFEQSGSV